MPIVTLKDGQGIKWADTLPDNYGNFYYTSFSPAGFIAPWLFLKIFKLPITEKSLYIFNSFLWVVSTILLYYIILEFYKNRKKSYFLAIIGVLLYAFSPEILHGLGYVYWHQSLMQLTISLQMLVFLKYQNTKKKFYKVLFCIFTLLNPYIEWTGFVINFGYAIFELVDKWKADKKMALKNCGFIILLSFISALTLIGHYALRINMKDFVKLSISRFLVRSNSIYKITLDNLLGEYISSFMYVWVLLIFLLIWNLLKNDKITFNNNKVLVFLMFFPILENILLRQHAVSYSFDRMKLIFFLVFIICELIQNILINTKPQKFIGMILLLVVIFTSALNFNYYTTSNNYYWKIDYKKQNHMLADYANEKYPNAVLFISNNAVRGYINLLFSKSIYEFSNLDEIKIIANSQNIENIMEIIIDNSGSPYIGYVYKLESIKVYNIKTNEESEIKLIDNKVSESY